MNQGKPKIILCGQTIALDTVLIQTLTEFSQLKVLINCRDLLTLSSGSDQELILWEIPASGKIHLKELSLIKDKYPRLKIVVIIESTSTKVAAEILKAGASDIFPKPVDHDLLVDRIVALLSLKN